MENLEKIWKNHGISKQKSCGYPVVHFIFITDTEPELRVKSVCLEILSRFVSVVRN